MKKQKSSGTVHLNLDQIGEVLASIVQMIIKILAGLKREQLQWLIGHKTQLANAIRDAIRSLVGTIQELPAHLIWWQNFYQEEGIVIDFATFQIPEKPEGDYWPIMVAPGRTYNQTIQMLRKKFPVWLWNEDLDAVIDLSKEQRRAINQPYVVWVKANIEADPDLVNKSANDLAGQKMIVLMERLLLEIFYFCVIAPGQHLDIVNWTLCPGSRCVGGSVPSVDFHPLDGEVNVSGCHPDDAGGHLRARSAVS